MSDVLDIHAACDAERIQVYRNLYDIWGGHGRNLEEHVQWRLASPQHNRACWFVGCLEDRPVTSLGAYQLEFQLHGRVVPGIAIGAVHTLAKYRGRGYASRLLDWVEQYQRNRGAVLSLLYSDIDPNFYARLGYQLCCSCEGWIGPEPIAETLLGEQSRATLVPISPIQQRNRLAKLYADFHSGLAISIVRNQEYWNYLLQKDATDEFYWLQSSAGERLGYARLAFSNRALKLRDWAVVEPVETTTRRLLEAVVRTGRERQVEKLGGWLPDDPAAGSILALRPRPKEITMLKSLSADVALGQDVLRDAQHFREIDHV